ncbi:Ubiquitin-protein ligase E3C [Trichoplax sp. H2]|nr:Ubiquitin-protein ligase E3C [Trichoplax sp. H2]|eukprot:RDD39745.1 Ubiquitin-protein ligase E3C [Trichoplax sp. H2]
MPFCPSELGAVWNPFPFAISILLNDSISTALDSGNFWTSWIENCRLAVKVCRRDSAFMEIIDPNEWLHLEVERNSFLNRTQQERRKRLNQVCFILNYQEQRMRNDQAKKIQATFRGYVEKLRQRTKYRKIFDQYFATEKSIDMLSSKDLFTCTRWLLFYYDAKQDGNRLLSLCKCYVKHRLEISSIHHIRKLISFCCIYISDNINSNEGITIPLRMIEIYTKANTYDKFQDITPVDCVNIVNSYVTQRGFFKAMRDLFIHRVPASIDESPNPPTPMAQSLLKLLLNVIIGTSDTSAVLLQFSKIFLSGTFSPQITHFLVPAICEVDSSFPLYPLIVSLVKNDHLKQSNRRFTLTPQINISGIELVMEPTPTLVYNLLQIGKSRKVKTMPLDVKLRYLQAIYLSFPCLRKELVLIDLTCKVTTEDAESDDDDEIFDSSSENLQFMRQLCLAKLDDNLHVELLVDMEAINNKDFRVRSQFVLYVCLICHAVIAKLKVPYYKLSLLSKLSLRKEFLHSLWRIICSLTATASLSSQSKSVLQLLSGSSQLVHEAEIMNVLIPLLHTFCCCLYLSFCSLHDTSFQQDSVDLPFDLNQIRDLSARLRDAAVGIIGVCHSRRSNHHSSSMIAFNKRPTIEDNKAKLTQQWSFYEWLTVCRSVTKLVKHLYDRDSRLSFCQPNHWLSPLANIQIDNLDLEYFFKDEEMRGRPTQEVALVQELPFVVSFQDRIKILHYLDRLDADANSTGLEQFMMGSLSAVVKRGRMYEDAFNALTKEKAPNLKKKIRVTILNEQGLEEAGIDGGGLFREFLTEVLKEGFNPNYGLFKLTQDGCLYPNSNVPVIISNFRDHYYFLGRILGKAIFEKHLVELPLAGFFLSKILSDNSEVGIHHLASLDPVMYKNLLSLKSYQGDIADLELNFTVVNENLGEAEVVDLKPGGQNIAVTPENLIEYIHKLADYKLNKEIRRQYLAFREGLADVLISGAEVPIDLQDLRANTNYSGGYSDNDEYINMFWDVAEDFTDKQRRKLLKFVTSCSRPPLLGFKELFPAFCIHGSGESNDETRLPSASTCMNLLKLPRFRSRDILKEKLTYAIESNSGFELS